VWKKVLAAGSAVLALGCFMPSDCGYMSTAAACEEGNVWNAPEGIPYSVSLGYGTYIQRSQMYYHGRVIMEGSTYEVNLDARSANEFPKLQAALENLSTKNWGYMRHSMNAWEPDLQEDFSQGLASGRYSDDGTVPYSYELSYSGLRADSTIFSCVGCEYIYLGGAHPVTYYKTHTFDTKTGKELKLSDIFVTTDGLAKVIVEETEKQIEPKSSMPDKAETLKTVQKMIDENRLQFGLTEDNFMVYFGSYAIGPYALGTLEIKIPYIRYSKMFNDKYVFFGYRAKG